MDDDARHAASSPKAGDEAKRAHRRRRFSRTRLPTPPPDPTAEEPGSPDSKDAHFFEYINALQQLHHGGRSDSLFAPAIAAEDAFDHLDKLYKLMEQMLNLRQQNAQLQKRLRDLEHLGWAHTALKDLQSSHRVAFADIPELDDDSSFAESLLDSMLSKKDSKSKPWTRSRLRHSLMRRQRNRSSSLHDRMDQEELQPRRASGEKSAKVSKWTKVKAAFRWEKASPSVSGAKSQDSGIGGMHPLNCEVARYLRVPSASDEVGVSPADSGAADGSTPGSLSSASSVDDLQRQEPGCIQEGLCPDEKHNGLLGDEVPRAAIIKARRKDCNREKHRLSARSDDVNIEFSDTEEVEAERSKGSPWRESEAINKQSVKRDHKKDVPTDIFERYQQVVAEEESKKPKRASKWVRVKKAFLTPYVHTNHGDKNENDQQASCNSCGKRDHHSYKDDAQKIQDEIQKNYRQLQKKLSLEFQDKLKEWEKLKANPSVALSGRSESSTEEQRDQAFMKKMEEWQRIKSQPSRPIQMIREENLAPEFKKKLEEWQKIKKYTSTDDSIQKPKKKLGEWPKWKSVSGPREEQPHAENQPLSDEFLKKLEEWRRMKESKHYDVKEKTPSPRSPRKNPKKEGTKELQWFEKELDKIEREKQRLEQERQKFLQSEERLTKLRRTVMGDGNKKDVLVHTPSGFYRFEGISRKFTQKLCEWEEAQGIGPEASTFALLTSNFTPHVTVDLYEANPRASKIIRSKSAESLAMPNFVQPCSSTSHHPSSLSLNDMEELERQCLAISNESSLHSSLEKLNQDDEPEAVIVEVEDVVEETAAPLEERLQEQHFPVYQREMELNVCEEKSLVVPCFQSVDPKSAQFSYFLIEELMKLVKTIEKDERGYEDQMVSDAYSDAQSPSEEDKHKTFNFIKLKDKNQMQKQRSDTVFEKIAHLQEIHSPNISDIKEEETGARFCNLLEAAQDSFTELLQMAEQLQHLLHGRCENKASFQLDSSYSDVCAITSELTAKLSELKRILTYFYAASDMTAPRRKIKHENSEDKIPDRNSEAKPDKVSTKRQRYKKKNYSSKTLESDDSDDSRSKKVSKKLPEDEAVTIDPQIVEKLVIPTKTNYLNAWEPPPSNETKPVDVFVKTTRKLFAPPGKPEQTKQQITEARDPKMDGQARRSSDDQERGNPEDISIETKILQRNISERRLSGDRTSREKGPERRILKERNLGRNKSPEEDPPERKSPEPKRREAKKQGAKPSESSPPSKSSDHCSSPQLVSALPPDSTQNQNQEPLEKTAKPPLPSPTPQRKASKEISPSIRLMLAKYNQMISGQETASVGGSSGSASPIWRSPVSERRLQAQRQRYLEEVQKIGGSEVKKSASMAVLNSERKPYRPLATPKDKGILRSTSASVIQTNTPPKEPAALKLSIPQRPDRRSLEERYNKLQKAKEQFLNSPSTPMAGSSSAPPVFPDMPKYPPRSRFSQISMASESSCESSYEGVLVKSASAGMINVDEDTYRTIDPAFHKEGYVSLPRSVQKQKERFLSGKLALANIAAKFRKVRMRKSKETKKMNTVSALCRQSLVVDINSSQEALSRRDSLTVPETNNKSSSEDTSPSSSRSGSWIRRSRIFKAL